MTGCSHSKCVSESRLPVLFVCLLWSSGQQRSGLALVDERTEVSPTRSPCMARSEHSGTAPVVTHSGGGLHASEARRRHPTGRRGAKEGGGRPKQPTTRCGAAKQPLSAPSQPSLRAMARWGLLRSGHGWATPAADQVSTGAKGRPFRERITERQVP